MSQILQLPYSFKAEFLLYCIILMNIRNEVSFFNEYENGKRRLRSISSINIKCLRQMYYYIIIQDSSKQIFQLTPFFFLIMRDGSLRVAGIENRFLPSPNVIIIRRPCCIYRDRLFNNIRLIKCTDSRLFSISKNQLPSALCYCTAVNKNVF